MVSSTTARVNFSRSMIERAVDGRALHLGRQFFLGGGIERQQIERPEQRGRGGLMAGEDHGRDLIAELFVGEGRAGLGIARGAHQVEQVARRRALVLAGGAALGHQHADECVQRLRKRARAKSCGLGQLSGSSRSRKCGRASRSPYSITKSRKRRAVAIHPEREHGASGDLERHPLHRLAQVHRRVAGGLELGDGLVGRRHHVRNQRRHRARRKRRRQRAALVFPGAPFGDQQAFAEHRPQHPEAGRRARIILVIVDQHMPDRIRRVEDEAAAPEEAALDDIFFIGALAPGADRRFRASP